MLLERPFTNAQWDRACLCLPDGGLGLQSASSRRHAAYWAGVSASMKGAIRVLGKDPPAVLLQTGLKES
eukprot:12932070-Prorocentrum_lima.AAC.1